jgi:SAM-dependent methyltransferase
LSQLVKKRFSYVGINPDVFQNNFAAARTKFRVPFFPISAGLLATFPHDSYDVVISHENAFYYKSRKAYLKNVMRVLRPGGLLLIHDVLSLGRVRLGHGLYTLEEYTSFAKEVGFEVCLAKDISNQILMKSFSDMYRLFGYDVVDSEAGHYLYVRLHFRKS